MYRFTFGSDATLAFSYEFCRPLLPPEFTRFVNALGRYIFILLIGSATHQMGYYSLEQGSLVSS